MITPADRLARLLVEAGEIIDRALVAEDPDEWYADGRACFDKICAWAIERARDEARKPNPDSVMHPADRLAEARAIARQHWIPCIWCKGPKRLCKACKDRREALAQDIAAYRSAPVVEAIPASRVRALAVKWTSTTRGVDSYMEGRVDQANVCAEELEALLREYEGGA